MYMDVARWAEISVQSFLLRLKGLLAQGEHLTELRPIDSSLDIHKQISSHLQNQNLHDLLLPYQ